MNEEQIREIIRDELSSLIRSERYTFQKNIQIFDGRNIFFSSGVGTIIGTVSQKFAFHNATPTIQQSKVSDPSTQANDLDSEARTAINAIIDVLEAKGLSATS